MSKELALRDLLARPAAFLPLILSALGLALVLGYVSVQGVGAHPQGDEGAAARAFQLIMGLQLVSVAIFAVTWLPRAARPALAILALQLASAAIPIVLILILESTS